MYSHSNNKFINEMNNIQGSFFGEDFTQSINALESLDFLVNSYKRQLESYDITAPYMNFTNNIIENISSDNRFDILQDYVSRILNKYSISLMNQEYTFSDFDSLVELSYVLEPLVSGFIQFIEELMYEIIILNEKRFYDLLVKTKISIDFKRINALLRDNNNIKLSKNLIFIITNIWTILESKNKTEIAFGNVYLLKDYKGTNKLIQLLKYQTNDTMMLLINEVFQSSIYSSIIATKIKQNLFEVSEQQDGN